MGPLDKVGAEIEHLTHELISQPIIGSGDWAFTQYMLWMLIALGTLLIVVFAAVKRESLIPKGRFLNAVEFLVEFVRNDMARGVISHNADKHVPFLLTLFFFILFNNLWGVIPGAKPGTGTIGITAALSLIAFVYFIYWGIKTHGPFGYVKSLVPSGIGFPLNIAIWLLELISTSFRLLTLAVRLFSNMFAGHVALGALAILASLFVEPLIAQVTGSTLLTASASIGWIILLVALYTVELLVALIQAYVFTVLTSVYIEMATSAH